MPTAPLYANGARRARTFVNPGAVNLTTQSGLPVFGPQKSYIIATAAAGAMSLTTEDNATLVFTGLAAGIPVPVEVPIKATVSSTTANLLCYWVIGQGPGDWAAQGIPNNP